MMSEYDLMLASPPEEKPQEYHVIVKITREFVGTFHGTEYDVKEEAVEYYKRHENNPDDIYISVEILND